MATEIELAIVYLGLGSNLGDRKQNLKQALELLSSEFEINKLSSLYETEPIGYTEQPLFLNAVCSGFTKLSPQRLLHLIKDVEHQLGRKSSFPNAPRPIDVDILFYNAEVIKTKELTIPHPRLSERVFALVPLAEISPDLVHPESGKTVLQLLDNLKPVKGVRRWLEAIDIVVKKG